MRCYLAYVKVGIGRSYNPVKKYSRRPTFENLGRDLMINGLRRSRHMHLRGNRRDSAFIRIQ